MSTASAPKGNGTETQNVSVVIPTYNYGRFIADAIESVLGQTVAPTEIIVVDDGSTDDTEAVVRGFGGRIKYIRQENAGVCAARNRGVAESSGDLIAFLDADDIWEPTKLEKQIAKFASDPAIGLVHCGMREYDSLTGKTICDHLVGGEGWLANDLLLWEKPVIIGYGGTVVVRRVAFEEVRGFDERLTVGEDLDFCYRIAVRFKVGFVKEILMHYRMHDRNSRANVREMERSLNLFYAKAFDTDDFEILRLRRRAYGNFHMVMAGSYFRVGQYRSFVRHAASGILNRPANVYRLFGFPVRFMKRALASR